jgi:hypothetical protein
MGTVTPNIGIYIPSAGETNYDAAFATGMMFIDQHNHSGPPNGGVMLNASSILPGTITYNLLASNITDTNTGIGQESGGFANRLELLGFLATLYAQSQAAGTGLVVMNGSTPSEVSMGNSPQIVWTNASGVAGNPTPNLAANVTNTSQAAFQVNTTGIPQNGQTGNGGADYQIQFTNIVFNQGGYYVNPGFVAPVTGVYQFSANIQLGGIVAGNTLGYIALITSAPIRYIFFNGNIGAVRNNGNGASFNLSQTIFLTSGQSVGIAVNVSTPGGGGSNNINIVDGTFSGSLLC